MKFRIMKDSPKEYAEELIKFFLPKMYCYFGSGMLTNHYDEKVALDNAKKCALHCIDQIRVFGNVLKLREELMYFNAVEKEIKKYNL